MQTNKRPAHLFLSECGDLHDTRKTDWASNPLRVGFTGHHARIKTTNDFKSSLRAGGYTWPGGYTLAFNTTDGGSLCFKCAKSEAALIIASIRHDCRDGWQVDGLFDADSYESELTCDHCNESINNYDEENN